MDFGVVAAVVGLACFWLLFMIYCAFGLGCYVRCISGLFISMIVTD